MSPTVINVQIPMQTPAQTPQVDPFNALLQFAQTNPAGTIIAGIVVGLWIIGKLDKDENDKLDNMSEEALQEALAAVRQRKRTSSPNLQQVLDDLEQLSRDVEELKRHRMSEGELQ